MSATIDVTAPAKLNLSLRVLRRRADGFHEIDSMMVLLPGLHDRLRFQRADQDEFSCNAKGVPADESNLVIRALLVFRRETGLMTPLSIHLEKNVPHGAGLGGGSSDAAATLRALDRIHGTGLSHEKLCCMAAETGSDIPFFLGSSVAQVGGRGDRVVDAPNLPRIPVLLLKPSFGISTPEAYKHWMDSKELPGISYDAQKFEWGELVNDLERPVFQKYLFLAEMKKWLLAREGVAGALMSGSGSTMYAVLEGPECAEAVISAARKELDPTLWAWAGELGG